MSSRWNAVLVAAATVGLYGGVAGAAEDPFQLTPGLSLPADAAPADGTTAAEPAPADRALFLQSSGVAPMPTNPAAQRRLLMAELDTLGLAKPLDDLRINVYGYAEGSISKNVVGRTREFAYPHDYVSLSRLFDTETDDPNLNQVDLTFERTVDRRGGKFDVGFRVDTVYGSDSRFIHANGMDFYGGSGLHGPDEQIDMPQVYVDLALPVGNGLRLRLGKFTYFKSVDPNASPFFSRSFNYNPGALPFTLTGALGTYDLTDRLTVDAGVVRGWDQALKDNNGGVSFVGQVAYRFPDDRTTLAVKFITGPELENNSGAFRTAIDAVLGYRVNDSLMLFGDGMWGHQSDGGAPAGQFNDANWWGVAGYALYRINPMLALNGRVEFYRDDSGATTGLAQNLYEATVGLTISPFAGGAWESTVKIRPEVRYDYSSRAAFGPGGATDHDQLTFAVDAIFNF